jgi:crotonobetainyl-CoA:carnitine CoA-transferase CaiB-like acyl-CoA transferase
VLGDALGVAVTKIESAHRPDGARHGSPRFWDRLNAGKENVTLDFTTEAGRRELHERLDDAAVVVSASRPRAFEHLGIAPDPFVRDGAVWVSITGYGTLGPDRDRVAFGDDAAVAGGLAVAAGGAAEPVFVGDAVADPLSGLVAAHTAAQLVGSGTAAFVDVCMAGVVNTALRGPELR